MNEHLTNPLTAQKATRRINITWNALLTIAGRDVMRFLRDPMRLGFTVILPIILVVGLAGPMQSNFGQAAGYNLMTFSMTGLLAMSLFQSTMSGLTRGGRAHPEKQTLSYSLCVKRRTKRYFSSS
jgi:ABC-2 type transport system permease protein